MWLARGRGEADQVGRRLAGHQPTGMSKKVVVRKVKGGKLFRLTLTRSPDRLEIMLEGDLFIHPEEGLEEIERLLVQCSSMDQEKDATRFLQSKLEEGSIQIIGADASELVSALWEAKG